MASRRRSVNDVCDVGLALCHAAAVFGFKRFLSDTDIMTDLNPTLQAQLDELERELEVGFAVPHPARPGQLSDSC